jgi:DNA invertase Pin-like site-specific DNA recombinase
MLFGYARVSTDDQETALQRDALHRAGVDRLFEEKRSGAAHRPLLEALLYCLRPGDVVLVYKVDRLARSLVDLLRVLARIEHAGASFRSLTEPLDTATPVGRMLLHMLGSFAEFERAVIRERCQAGREAARRRGVRFGRPPKLDLVAVRRLASAGHNQSEIARRFGCHPSSVNKALRRIGGTRGIPGQGLVQGPLQGQAARSSGR